MSREIKNFIYYLSIAILSISCSEKIEDINSEDSETNTKPDCSATDDKSLEIITGIRFFDETGSKIGQAGNPNVSEESSIRVYPNPNNGVISISKQNNTDYNLFIFPCQKDTSCADVDYNDVAFEYSIDSLYNLDSTAISINIPDLKLQFHPDFEIGYYKLVFYNENEGAIVENIYFDSTKPINEMIEFLNSEF